MSRTLDEIFDEFRAAGAAGDEAATKRLLAEEAALVLLGVLAALEGDPTSFVHAVALKGGLLMLGEFQSPRFSADLDFTHSKSRKTVSRGSVEDSLRRAGSTYGLRLASSTQTRYGLGVSFTFVSRCLGRPTPAKLEISYREDLVFPVRDAIVDGSRFGIPPFSVPAVDPHELVAEKIRCLAQRAQPRDLFDTWYYLENLPALAGRDLRQALDTKFQVTASGRYRTDAWRGNLSSIESQWGNLEESTPVALIPSFAEAVEVVERRLRHLGIR